MTRYDFVLFAGQREDFIDRLRELGLVDITVRGWEPSEEDRLLLLDIEGHAKALEFVKTLREDAERFRGDAAPFASGEEAYDHYASAMQQCTALNTELARLEKMAEELRPWGTFDLASQRALAERGVVMRYFVASKSTYDKLEQEWSIDYTITEIHRSESMVYFVVVAAPGEEVAIDAQEMKAPQMDIREADHRIAEIAKQICALDAVFSRVAATEKLLRMNAASLREKLQMVRISSSAGEAADGKLLLLEGWAEKTTSDQVDTLLESYPNVVYIKSAPTPDDEVPVKLSNHWFSRVFEFVGDMYARPKYGTMDLTPFFAPFYMLFFGICLNDAGYGVILVALGAWLLHKNPNPGTMRQAAWFATLCGISTTLFGAFCGSFFGLSMSTYLPGIPFYDFQGKFFSVALAIGVVQIIFGMILKVVMISSTLGFRYSLGALGWLLVILAGSLAAGLPMMNPAWAIPFYGTASPAFYATLGLGALLMFFFNSPGKNPLLNFGLGIWDTYNNITGILSDVLSYIRLFAIGLSGGILATVFNSLADGFVPEGANIAVRLLIMIPILLIGHGINLFMSCISSFVHPMRLTFVEFYKNAGFEMSTRIFEPLRKVDTTENQ